MTDPLLDSSPDDESSLLLHENINQPFTTSAEVFGWCLYSWAAEPFIVSVVGTYVPLLLEQIARDNGVKLIDKITPCNQPHDPTIPIPSPPKDGDFLNSTLTLASQNDSCVLPIFGGRFYIDTSSYALYTFSISVLIQTVLVISMSGAADRGSHRKSMLVGFGVTGGLITMCYWLVDDRNYYMASLLAILANSAFGGVNVCGNSFLSLLVNNHPSVRQINLSKSSKLARMGEISSKISGMCAASGYISALLMQIITMLVILHVRNNPNIDSLIYPLKLVIGLVGLWWFVFQLPIQILLKPRLSKELHVSIEPPDPSEPGYSINSIRYKILVVGAYILHGYKTLLSAARAASQLKDIMAFLLGWFIISDSLTTINSTAILFAKSDLQMTTVQLSQIGVLTMVSAIAGSVLLPNVIQPYFKLGLKQTMILIIVWASIIPLYGILGFFIRSLGLHHAVEMYVLAIWYGFSLGGVATISRSLYSMLIPPGQESVFFALFSITDKGSSIVGPFLVGLIIDKTHDIRKCFWLLFLLLIAAVPVFWYGIDVDRGINEATVLEHEQDE
ncbi:hypothetical protein KL918_004113 [Ogataea parapolymorpha]|uniref:Autophagy-related protein n=1 Tax=Ogataea parapolymorpha (strain ATCC 26012 / BCRC 20466 / JCM 22074 / NRRL Y-7560 / DL-1) TaxID=871575 RepID=W1QE03_OGAPD|nr:Autophagy-related protein 22 [Ogataea parapolymorpha DL-1]ESW98143.1 Autophagy-related protein 22 [Ogataea parapolymorpha DL-1]KAG7866124.1 hypothetical protein KL918_004113 [Ogataea parapolymorpha]KAG7874721.1 hypothetical protein KL916_000965 [Ogataea parapolymorpha]